MTILELARKFRYVRELQGNRGQRIEAIQRWGGGVAGDSWCAFWATMVMDIWFEGKSPIARTGGCDAILEQARGKGWLTDTPAIGDLYLRLRSKHDAHHVGFVTAVYPRQGTEPLQLGTISANTSKDGTSSNGDGVYEHDIVVRDPAQTITFVHYPLV